MLPSASTGLSSLDALLAGVRPGDNIVWQLDRVEDYRALVEPCAKAAEAAGRRLIYFRFASHERLVQEPSSAEVHTPDPNLGFESFVAHVHRIIEDAGKGAVCVFDCLSELASIWSADQMLGNFFLLICPRLCELEALAYFGLYRNHHASFALNPITETAQFLLEVFRHKGKLYVRPIKSQRRSSQSMNTIHVWEEGGLKPITNSAIVSEALTASRWPGLRADTRLGVWRRVFNEAQQTYDDARAGRCAREHEQEVFARLSRMVLSRDDAMLRLAHRYLSLADILEIRDRMVGIGLIGGKALGMLLGRAILKHDCPALYDLLESHDSFYIGSDVFYTFLIRNGVWWLRQKQRDPNAFLEGLGEAQERILRGHFPDYTMDQFQAMLDYFGESPYIVRSSSLLEDAYGNAFAGKYDSVFCVNQGTREERLQTLLETVRRVYASAMSEKALRYRVARGLLDRDEQMALLVMRVSGERYGNKFFPKIAGVAFSFNPYVWHKEIDPRAGVARLVFGLGTRAVERDDHDHARLVALNAPSRRPESNFDEVCEYSQHKVDYLDISANRFASQHVLDLAKETPEAPLEMVASRNALGESEAAHYALTFEGFLSNTPFVEQMRQMLKTIEAAYQNPVDIEFTVNFLTDREYRVNLLQCRPLQVQGAAGVRVPSVDVRESDRIVETHGGIIGPSRVLRLTRIIYVVPRLYGELPLNRRYEVARLVGRINQAGGCGAEATMLLGPGRWGTSSPDLGIPVHFAEISRMSVLGEIVGMREDLVPDVSLGTHFLNELVEMNILYMAIFPQQRGNRLNESFFLEAPNQLLDVVPSASAWQEMVRVVDARDLPGTDRSVLLCADANEQTARVFVGDSQVLSQLGVESGWKKGIPQ